MHVWNTDFFFKQLWLVFILCWIYFQTIRFYFFGFFLGYLVPNPADPSSGPGASRSSSVRVLSVWTGECMGVSPPARSVGSAPHLGSLVHLDGLQDQRIYIQTLKLGITLCIFKRVRQKIQHSFWATAPESGPTVWPGHTCQPHHHNDGRARIASCKVTSFSPWWLFGYAYPGWPGLFHRCSSSEHKGFNFLIYMTLWGVLGQVTSGPF